jgi:hypothetical protein
LLQAAEEKTWPASLSDVGIIDQEGQCCARCFETSKDYRQKVDSQPPV